jgi:hypothetical protein
MPFILLEGFLCDFFELYVHTYIHPATEHFIPSLVEQYLATGHALLTLESLSQKVLGLVCAELGRSVFSSMATRRTLQTETLQNLY